MNLVKRAAYWSCVYSIKAYQRLFVNLHVWGRENIPSGPKIYASNHIAASDALWVLPLLPEPVHIVIGPGYASRVAARVYDWFEQINALPAHCKSVVPEAVTYIQKGEPVCIAPEGGDLQEPFRLGKFFPDVARIYRQCRVPIVPVAFVAPQRNIRRHPSLDTTVEGHVYHYLFVQSGIFCVNFGEPWLPECPAESDARNTLYITRGLRERIAALVEDVRVNKFWLE